MLTDLCILAGAVLLTLATLATLAPELWALRHRRAIRARLQPLGERERSQVYLALALNRLAPRPRDERHVVELTLREIGWRETFDRKTVKEGMPDSNTAHRPEEG